MVGKSVNEILYDRSVQHATHVDRFSAGERNRVLKFLNTKVFPDIEAQARSAMGSRSERLRQLEPELRQMAHRLMLPERTRFTTSMGELAQTESEFQTAMLRDVVPSELGISFTQVSPEILRRIVNEKPIRGRFLDEWFDSLEGSISRGISEQIRIGLVEGESIPQMVRRVRDIKDLTRRQAAAVVRTATTEVTNSAREATYEQNQDILKGVQYVATLDDRTTIICASLDGQVFPINEGPRPPQHINCRSTTTPITRSWEELGIPLRDRPSAGTRASMNGQVPDVTTFPKWLKAQPISVQNEVLGVGRAELWRSGKISFDKFLDGGRVLSLAELRAKSGL